jgi:hypothetical protein
MRYTHFMVTSCFCVNLQVKNVIFMIYLKIRIFMDKLGTIIHGIGASEHLDSSGERIEVEGVDISSLTVDGLVNFEHKSEAPSQFIGKIIEATKIFKKDDCKNAHHEKFWDKAGKTPFLYIKAVLFDKFDHVGAKEAVAMLKFDEAMGKDEANKDTRQVCGFSIEGSRLAKEGSLIKKCIARKMSFTAFPCNKACVAEILNDESEDTKKVGPGKLISLKDLKSAFKKSQEMEIDLAKGEGKYSTSLSFKAKKPDQSQRNYSKIGPTAGEQREAKPWAPKQTMPASSVTPKTSLVGTRQTHDQKKPKTGASIYKDPATWKSELDSMSNSRKAQINKIKKNVSAQHMKTTVTMSEKIMNRKDILKSLSQEAFDMFPHKEELLASVKKSQPEASEKEVLAIAKTYAYIAQKKEEIKLAELASESSLNDE